MLATHVLHTTMTGVWVVGLSETLTDRGTKHYMQGSQQSCCCWCWCYCRQCHCPRRCRGCRFGHHLVVVMDVVFVFVVMVDGCGLGRRH